MAGAFGVLAMAGELANANAPLGSHAGVARSGRQQRSLAIRYHTPGTNSLSARDVKSISCFAKAINH